MKTTDTRQANHTPIPWEIKFFPKQFEEEVPVFFIRSTDTHLPSGFPRPEIMADDAHEGNGYPIEQKLADANLIVTAVNNHEELMNALKELYDWSHDLLGGVNSGDGGDSPELKKAKKILKKLNINV